jgi:hypothetical protein
MSANKYKLKVSSEVAGMVLAVPSTTTAELAKVIPRLKMYQDDDAALVISDKVGSHAFRFTGILRERINQDGVLYCGDEGASLTD